MEKELQDKVLEFIKGIKEEVSTELDVNKPMELVNVCGMLSVMQKGYGVQVSWDACNRWIDLSRELSDNGMFVEAIVFNLNEGSNCYYSGNTIIIDKGD